MKKIIGITLAIFIVVTMILTGLSCVSGPAGTTTPPPSTTPPVTTTPAPTTPTPTRVEGLDIAEESIRNSATFKFDGIADSLKMIKAEDGQTPSSAWREFTITFQTGHPGHGDRTGQALDLVITPHTAVIVVDIKKGSVISAVCDNIWDLLADKSLTTTVSGIVISGGDTALPGGPLDVPHRFVYKIQKADGAFINVSYTAYPPSPIGDAQKKKIVLSFRGGSIQVGDLLNARGVYSADTNTVIVMNEGDYIITMLTEEAAQKIAEDFIRNSSTYKFDGIAGSLKFVKTEPGFTSAFRSDSYFFTFQTAHPGHGDRTGEFLAQVITDHTAIVLVNIETGEVAWAVCDQTWDMVHEKDLPVTVSGIVAGGGDTAAPGGPLDVPHRFVYQIQKADGTFVNVSYTAYPPSPVGDAQKEKITLDFYSGGINIGDKMEAYGTLDRATNTVVIANLGDYIRTSVPKMEVSGLMISGGDTTPADGLQDAPRVFVYKLQKDDGTFINISYTAYPPSPAGDAHKITLSLYQDGIQAGDYMKAYGTINYDTGTILVAADGDFIKTYPRKP